jgi:RNA polymerase sigma-70 factor, ECF subfamily
VPGSLKRAYAVALRYRPMRGLGLLTPSDTASKWKGKMPQIATMPDDPESSVDLLLKAQSGDAQALNDLFERYLPRLQRWASGRMPSGIRSMNDTGDIVQEAVINAVRNLNTLEIRTEGTLLAYLRRAVHNRIIDQYRRHGRRPPREEIPETAVAANTSPLEAAIGAEALENYERALASLREEDRQAIILRVELGLAYDEMATQLGKPSAGAARMAATRAIARLAEAMRRGR